MRTQVALADRRVADPSTVSRLVARLERDGLVVRRPGKDRRTVEVELTEDGRREVAVFDGRAGEDGERRLADTPPGGVTSVKPSRGVPGNLAAGSASADPPPGLAPFANG